MANIQKENNSESKFNLPRRHFISAALVGGVGFFSRAEIKAASKDVCSELLALPTPADALVDFFDFLSGVESGILGQYYGVVGRISGEISTKYSDLKKAAGEFRRLVPQLRAGADVPRFQNMADIGMISAAFIGSSPLTSNAVFIDSHSNVVKLTSNDLEHTVRNWTSEKDSLTLSPAAVEKLREMLKLIGDLEKPTKDLDIASTALTKASEDVRQQIGQIRPLVKDATRLLVAAEILESPPPTNSAPNLDAVAILLKKLGKNKEPTTIAGLRSLAVQKIRESSGKLDLLSRYVVPKELSQYLTPAASSRVADSTSMPIDVLQKLLDGTVSWIERGDEKPKQVSRQASDAVRFLPASMTYSAGWFSDLWGQIRGVLAEQIPQATHGRIWQLYYRKVAISVYSADEQARIFYNLLPYLSQPSEVDLWADRGVRQQAATRLSRL